MQDAKHIRSFDSPFLYVERKVLNPEFAFAKRAFDVCASLLGLIILSPIMLIPLYPSKPTTVGRHFISKFGSLKTVANSES
jgi:lipopolysaccharide/colanic/teichoic acid biosynthesis glycosyltransferase